MRRRLVSVLALAGVALAGVALALVLIEGLASTLITVGLILSPRGRLAETRYGRYDGDLGWASRPNLAIPDMWGPKASLHTDANGFRGRVAPAASTPPGKVRVICSGDSFTFGYGVGDDQTWCAQLAELDPRLETINMGQGGYGVDQAFLWYRRDGVRFAPTIHLFAFIDGDFDRMQTHRFLDHGKPMLLLHDGALDVERAPAERWFWRPSVRVLDIVRRTRSYELFDRVTKKLASPAVEASPDVSRQRQSARLATEDVALAVFAELRAMAQANGGTAVLVYLPIGVDCLLPPGAPTGLDWWRTIGPRARAAGFQIVDLSDRCRRLPAAEQNALFIPSGELQYYAAAGHYTEAGNRFVALALDEELRPLIDAASAAHR